MQIHQLVVADVCALARTGRTALYQAINAGQLRALKRGRRTLILAEDLRRWLETLPTIAVKQSSVTRGGVSDRDEDRKDDLLVKALAETGSVTLRNVSVALDSNVAEEFVRDCARHTEGVLSDADIKAKWGLARCRLGGVGEQHAVA